jgi:hypothetical protein
MKFAALFLVKTSDHLFLVIFAFPFLHMLAFMFLWIVRKLPLSV